MEMNANDTLGHGMWESPRGSSVLMNAAIYITGISMAP